MWLLTFHTLWSWELLSGGSALVNPTFKSMLPSNYPFKTGGRSPLVGISSNMSHEDQQLAVMSEVLRQVMSAAPEGEPIDPDQEDEDED